MSFVFFILCIYCCMYYVICKPIYTEIPAGGEECFYEFYNAGEDIEFLYVIKRGGQHDIELKVFDPNNQLIAQKIATKYDRFQQKTTINGEYKICFNNGMSRWIVKLVGIDILGIKRPQIEHYNDLTKKRHLSLMERIMYNIEREIDKIDEQQQLSISIEQSYWNSVVNSSNLFSYITLFELGLLILINIYQIRKIRSWFKAKKRAFGI